MTVDSGSVLAFAGSAAGKTAQSGATERDPRIDFLRGFALLSILLNHAQQIASIYYPIPTIRYLHPGLSDSAELFVFLSGISMAIVFSPRILSGERIAVVLAVARRVGKIYLLQILIVLAVFLLYVLIPVDGPAAAKADLMHLSDDPMATILDVLLLRLQPSYINILPLYLVLLLCTPAMLVLLSRWPRASLVGSGAIYLISLLLHYLEGPGHVSSSVRWSFFPGSWQFLYVIGLWRGLGWRKGLRWRPGEVSVALSWIVFALASALRLSLWWTRDLHILDYIGINKRFLEPVLLLHFFALMILWQRYVLVDSAWLRGGPATAIARVGQHSLEIFAIGTILSFAVALLSLAFHSRGLHILGSAISVALVFVFAWILASLRRKNRPETGQVTQSRLYSRSITPFS